jgi:hypothetical protein
MNVTQNSLFSFELYILIVWLLEKLLLLYFYFDMQK